MFRGLLPREIQFFDYFEQQAALVTKACEAFMELTRDGNDDYAAQVERIKHIEHEADEVTHRCMDDLNKTFITPMDRSDIHALIKRMDDVVDSVDAVTSRMALYRVRVMRDEARKLAEVLFRASRDIEAAVHGLRNLKNAREINDRLIAIHASENEGDTILRAALTRLFDDETDAILIIKWKEIFERLEKATDRCEGIANTIEKILIEAS
jgi:predicted phosphate transport protein (TIGR00153 family)